MESVSDFESMQLLFQGAEAKIYAGDMAGVPVIVKKRLNKSYRVKELDSKLLKQRLTHEVRCLTRCRRAGVLTPTVYMVDPVTHSIYMEHIVGSTMKLVVDKLMEDEVRGRLISRTIGTCLGKMHDAGVVHGDLTTSNIMIKDTPNEPGFQVVMIDFGLATMQPNIEDKAVDLYVLERAFTSTHPGCETLMQNVLDSYRFSGRDAGQVLQRLEHVRQRGRKRDMIG